MVVCNVIMLLGVFVHGFYMANAASFMVNSGYRKTWFLHRHNALLKFLKVIINTVDEKQCSCWEITEWTFNHWSLKSWLTYIQYSNERATTSIGTFCEIRIARKYVASHYYVVCAAIMTVCSFSVFTINYTRQWNRWYNDPLYSRGKLSLLQSSRRFRNTACMCGSELRA